MNFYGITAFALCFVALAGLSPGKSGYISRVSLSSETLDVGKGRSVRIQYALDREALATIRIYDAGHYVVRTLAQDKPSFAGVNTVSWNGFDDANKPVPNEAYYFTISCVDQRSQIASYDPPTFSGAERITFSHRDLRYDAAAGGVVYQLDRSARVQIRAGVREGPLLKTILDWAPRRPGRHAEPWDEKDESGLITVTALSNHSTIGRAYVLPENSIFVIGSPSAAADASAVDRPYQRGELPSTAARTAALKRATIIETSLAKRKRPIDPHVWTPFGKNASPSFQVSLVGAGSSAAPAASDAEPRTASSAGVPTVSGAVGIKVTLDEPTRVRLQEQRFEIVAYLDFQLVGEQEQGYSPYIYILDTTRFSNGEHVVTINVAGLQDQVSARSLKINIYNPASK